MAQPGLSTHGVKSQARLISLYADRLLLHDLYTASSQIIIASTDIEILDRLPSQTNLSFYQFQFDPLTSHGTITRCGEIATEKPVPISIAPAFCTGYLVASPHGKQELYPLIEWWKKHHPSESCPPLLDLTAVENTLEVTTEFWRFLFDRSQQETQTIATRLSGLQKQYLELRSFHETVQNAFATIESFLSQAKLPALQLAFENQPTPQSIAVEAGKSHQIQQGLPVPSQGLAAIEIYIAKCHADAVGTLALGVHTLEENTTLAQWHIPYEHLTPGWFPLDLPTIDMGRKQEIELRIGWNTRVEPPPRLALGGAQPIPEACVHQNGQTLNGSLAMRLWTGLPGSRRCLSPYSSWANEPELTSPKWMTSGHLGEKTLSGVLAVVPNSPDESKTHIVALEKGKKILTHPQASGVTVAMLPFAFPAGTTTVRATVCTEHFEASTIEYALALVKDGEETLTYFENDEINSGIPFSGWISIEPETPRQITVSLTQPADEHYHIVFGTRLPPGSINNYGWAHWLDFLICESSNPVGE
ncbi:MAG: DUF6212 domain-containing protein [Geitlerinemataceae cyanobacterium]